MVLRTITIIALFTSNAIMCMDNNNNKFKEDQEYDSGDEVKINPDITDKQSEKYLQQQNPGPIEPHIMAYKNYVEQHYSSLKGGNTKQAKQTNPPSISVTEQFKQAVVAKSIKWGKTESMSSSDFLKVKENGMENDGQ